MKVNISHFLTETKPEIKKLVDILSKDFKYVSVLGTDVSGKIYSIRKTGINFQDSFWNERGFVVKIFNGINYSEFSFNEIPHENIQLLADKIKSNILKQLGQVNNTNVINNYPLICEEESTESYTGEVGIIPETTGSEAIIKKMTAVKDKAFAASDVLFDCRVNYQHVHVSKIFVSNKKDLMQSYIFSEGGIFTLVKRDDNIKYCYQPFSGLYGTELIDSMEEKVDKLVNTTEKLLDAKQIIPGEYDVICSPDVSGIIAHEAFGHGVEMDMFVKNRALAVNYMGKQIASKLVTMRDGAKSAKEVSSYLFDDEGVLGTDTVIIDKGILKAGLSDTQSALYLKTTPTGNGKRQSFERKAYARMTNTFFEPGKDKLSHMIASIKHGYFIDCPMSGMEDPKNWGIQCMVQYGIEIKDGKLTDNYVSPIVMTGYVPDLLKSISMVSEQVHLSGTGACGKGYKEFVKVSSGGPYIKGKARLG